jgi:hypothetical protein
MKNNRIVCDLNKIQFGSLHYVNQYGDTTMYTPKPMTTVRGESVRDEMAAYHPDYPLETMRERALRLDLFDYWTPVCTFQLSANHNLTYTGEKALAMWKAWNSKIFKKKE